MIPNPILKVLSTIRKHQVQALLMGGQACVFYGAAEFSRDTDLALLGSPENLQRLHAALQELEATCIAVPPFQLEYLQRGHAIHFRCQLPEVRGMRVDVMSVMRASDDFPALWSRRTTVEIPGSEAYDLLALPDLVQAKKTQRDKDWPMLRRLVEAHYFQNRQSSNQEKIRFWFKELRSPEILTLEADQHPELCRSLARQRPLLLEALSGNQPLLEAALMQEELEEKRKDRDYWRPLKAELEALRRARIR